MLNVLDLFSGIGGFSLGLEATGFFKTKAFCEIDPFCQKVLKKHWPDIPIHDDIRRLKGKHIGTVDIITGGYPCQPFSVAGKQKAEKDPRHLWPEYFRLIKECRPTWVIGENVNGHIKLGLDSVLKDLASENYSTRAFSISASSIGANHKRERIWIVSYSNSHTKTKRGECSYVEKKSNKWTNNKKRSRGHDWERCVQETGKHTSDDVAYTDNTGCKKQWQSKSDEKKQQTTKCRSWWELEPNVGRVAHGIPNRVHRLKSLGNSVVPHIPYHIGMSIIKSYE